MTNVTTASSLPNTDGTRFKRHVGGFPMTYASNQELNELSYRVLRSVEAAMVADMDSANCLRRILCEDNQYSTSTNDGRKIWVPVWRYATLKKKNNSISQGRSYGACLSYRR